MLKYFSICESVSFENKILHVNFYSSYKWKLSIYFLSACVLYIVKATVSSSQYQKGFRKVVSIKSVSTFSSCDLINKKSVNKIDHKKLKYNLYF